MTARRGASIAAMESHKRKLSGRGRGPAELADVWIGRKIAGKVGNTKKADTPTDLGKSRPKW